VNTLNEPVICLFLDTEMGVGEDRENSPFFTPKPDDDGSEFHLNDELRLLAQSELREDDATRQQALQQMREWIQKHPDIKCCRTGMQ
jgi:hypothetical protein